MSQFVIDPLFDYTPKPTTTKPKPIHRNPGKIFKFNLFLMKNDKLISNIHCIVILSNFNGFFSLTTFDKLINEKIIIYINFIFLYYRAMTKRQIDNVAIPNY